MSNGCIGIITWDACEFCANYSDENGCEIMLDSRNPYTDVSLYSEEVFCLDFLDWKETNG